MTTFTSALNGLYIRIQFLTLLPHHNRATYARHSDKFLPSAWERLKKLPPYNIFKCCSYTLLAGEALASSLHHICHSKNPNKPCTQSPGSPYSLLCCSCFCALLKSILCYGAHPSTPVCMQAGTYHEEPH